MDTLMVLLDGLKAMVLGMGMVYVFLIIMICSMKIMEVVLRPFATLLDPPAAAPKKAAPAPAAAGSASITAPMNGTIVDVKVKAGDKVTNGTVVAILEAMKMENDIVCDKDGVVASVNVAKGDAVETGSVVITIN